MKEKKIIKADTLLRKMMWEKLKFISLKGALIELRKIRNVKKHNI
jgi:hypothetical protein